MICGDEFGSKFLDPVWVKPFIVTRVGLGESPLNLENFTSKLSNFSFFSFWVKINSSGRVKKIPRS